MLPSYLQRKITKSAFKWEINDQAYMSLRFLSLNVKKPGYLSCIPLLLSLRARRLWWVSPSWSRNQRGKNSFFWAHNWSLVSPSNFSMQWEWALLAFEPICKMQKRMQHCWLSTVWRHLELESQWLKRARGSWELVIQEWVIFFQVADRGIRFECECFLHGNWEAALQTKSRTLEQLARLWTYICLHSLLLTHQSPFPAACCWG